MDLAEGCPMLQVSVLVCFAFVVSEGQLQAETASHGCLAKRFHPHSSAKVSLARKAVFLDWLLERHFRAYSGSPVA